MLKQDSSKILEAETSYGLITFTHSIKKGLKRVYIRVERGSVVLRSAPMPEKTARNFIIQRAEWIHGVLEKMKSAPEPNPMDRIFYLGTAYDLIRQEDASVPVGRVLLEFKSGQAVFRYNPAVMRDELIRKELLKFYRREADRIIKPLVAKWSDITGFKPSGVAFRNVRSRWGSCSSKGNLSFNINLVMADLKAVEYVVVHELCHLKHHNHGKDFWAEVERFLPDYGEMKLLLNKKLVK